MCWLLQDVIGREIRKGTKKCRKSENMVKKNKLLKIKQKKVNENQNELKKNIDKGVQMKKSRPQPTPSVNKAINQTPKGLQTNNDKINIQSSGNKTEHFKDRKKSSNKENIRDNLEDKLMGPSSTPAKLKYTQTDGSRKTRGRRINYTKLNEKRRENNSFLQL